MIRLTSYQTLTISKPEEEGGTANGPDRPLNQVLKVSIEAKRSSTMAAGFTLKLGEYNIDRQPLHLRIEMRDKKSKNCSHIVQITTPAEIMQSNDSQIEIIIDIEIFNIEYIQRWDNIPTQIECFHELTKSFFFENILTGNIINLMEPEY